MWPFKVSAECQTLLDALDRPEEWKYIPRVYPELAHSPSGIVFFELSSGWWIFSSGSAGTMVFNWWEDKKVQGAIARTLNRKAAEALRP